MGNISKIRVGGVTYPLNDSSVNEELRREVERAYTAEGEIKENILGIEARIDDLDNKISSGEGNKELEEKVNEIDSIVKENEKVTASALNELKESINGIVDSMITDIPIATTDVIGGIKSNSIYGRISDNPFGEEFALNVLDNGTASVTIPRADESYNYGVVKVDSSVNPNSMNPVSGKGVAEYVEDAINNIEIGDINLSDYAKKEELNSKQDKLVSGTNIKTINGTSILGSGDIEVSGGDLSDYVTKEELNGKQDTITDLEVIRQGAAKGATSVQQGTLSTVATSGSYNDLINKPTIPNAVSESTVSGWGFTKNEGTVTGIQINGSTKNPSSGVVNLGTVITSHQDISGKQDTLVSGTNIKTINGESILGEGDIIIEGGSSDANVQAVDTTETLDDVETNTYVKYVAQTLTEEQKAQVRENIGVNSKSILEAPFNNTVAGFTGDSVMKHGVIYVSMINNIDTITIENFEAPDEDVVEYVWHFKTSTMPTLFLPSYIYWANGELPEIEDYTIYELSITATRDYSTDDYIYKAVLVPFKTI